MAGNKKIINELENNIKEVHEELYGNDGSLTKETNMDMSLINDSINKFTKSLETNVGTDPIDFYNSLMYNDGTSKKNKDNINTPNHMNEFMDANSNPLFSDGLIMMEQNRINLYNQYQLIYDHIPQVAQGLDTYVDNILSPDDFTKMAFNIFYDKKNINDALDVADKSNETIIENIKKLNSIYKIDVKAIKIIRDTLIKGDQFCAVLDIEDEINKMISEDGTIQYDDNPIHKLNETIEISLSNDEFNLLSEDSFIETETDDKKDKSTKNKDETKKSTRNTRISLEKEIAGYINNNVIITEDVSSLFEDNIAISEAFNGINKNIYGTNANLEKTLKKYNKETTGVTSKRSKNSDLGINGCVFKNLEPNRVIKLEMDEIDYGSYVIEGIDFNQATMSNGSPSNMNNSTISSAYNSQNSQSIGMGMSMVNFDKSTPSGGRNTTKDALITNIFIRGISDKLDKKFIRKNKQFKDLIYGLLKENYILQKQIKITYIPPKNIQHFHINKTEVYGDSLFRKILFPSKLYLAVLISSMLTKLTRAQDRRVYYIEVGLDNDEENTVQSFVRDIKNKEFKMSNYNDINVILNQPGLTADYYMPVVNGEKPVEIDTLQGMDVQQDNELLEYLLKSMISGLGVPGAFLNYTEDVEFVRTLTMQNGKFVRSIITLQKQFSDQFSELIRKMYSIHYKDDFKTRNTKSSSISKMINLEDITVTFPAPSSLNVTTLSDQINSSQNVIDFIIKTLVPDNEENTAILPDVTKEVTKDFLPAINWSKYEDIVEKARINANAETIKKLSTTDDGTSGDSSMPDDEGTTF